MEIEKLEDRLPDNIYKKLVKANFDTCKSILLKSRSEIQQITKLTFEDVNLLLEVISETYIGDRLRNASEIPEWKKISIGCKSIDDLLHGGISVNGINEIYGESGVGKTQFCLQLSLMVQLPPIYGGLNKGAVYICTEDPFPSKRLRQLGQALFHQFGNVQNNFDFENRIFVEHIADFEQLRIFLYVKLQKLIDQADIGIIIIDSIAGIFRSYNEDRNYKTRSDDFQTIARKLYEFCSIHSIGIVCTNQVSDNLETGEKNPCLGLAWSNWTQQRPKKSAGLLTGALRGSILRIYDHLYTGALSHASFRIFSRIGVMELNKL